MKYAPNQTVYVRCRVMCDEKSYAARVGERGNEAVWFLYPITKSSVDATLCNAIVCSEDVILTKDDLLAAIKGLR